MFKTYWQYTRGKHWWLILAPLVVLVEVIAELQQPNLLATIVNGYEAGSGTSIIWQTGWKMIAFLLLGLTFSVLSVYLSNVVAAYFGQQARKQLFAKVNQLSLGQINQLTPGSLLTRLTSDINQLQNLLAMLLRVAARAPLMFLGALFYLGQINRQLLLIVLVLAPAIVLVIVITAKLVIPLFRRLQKKLDEINNRMSENLSGIRTIKSFNREDWAEKRFANINNQLAKFKTKGMKILAWSMPAIFFILNLATAAILWWGNKLFAAGTLPIGSLIAATSYLSQLLFSFMMISFIFLNIMRVQVSSERIKEITKLKPNLLESAHPTTQKITQGKIELQQLTFCYPQEQKASLSNINLTINPNSTVGFIGTTGSGKSTLALLLTRLYDPNKGKILIDGIDLRDYPMTEIRNKIVLVLQESILMSGTIKDNLLWGQGADDKRIPEALAVAQAESFVKQREGQLKSKVERRGVNFSGGQRQRLSLARALARDFKILIMDDTTSALDFKTAALVNQALRQHAHDVTKVIISQRIASVKDCDQIVVIDEGKISHIGTHQQLLKTDHIYQQIATIQEENQ